MLPEMMDKYRGERHLIFADPDAEDAPSGLLKVEFLVRAPIPPAVPVSVLLRALSLTSSQADQTQIRGIKMYYILCTRTGDKMVRVKGASRETHKYMRQEDFGQQMNQPLYANRYRLGPTRGHDMAIRYECRKVISAFNGKRRCEVRLLQTFLSLVLTSAPRLTQDAVHSYPL